MTVYSENATGNIVSEHHSGHEYQETGNRPAYLMHEGKPHGDQYARLQMDRLCRISWKPVENRIDAANAFAVLKDTILAFCEKRIAQAYLKHNVILMDNAIFHIRKAVARLPINIDLRNEFGVKDRRALEDVLLGMEYYVTGDMDPRDMAAELDALVQY